MPIDQYEDEDDEETQSGVRQLFNEFDCPTCNANNPCDPPFGDGAELMCNYCGAEFVVRLSDEGRLRFKEL